MDVTTLILGAGAAGLFCAGRCGEGAVVLDHAARPAEKVRISGGGRCNFTNIDARPEAFLSANPHFAKSALARFTAHDFLALVEAHLIPWHEKTRGQLFCDRSSRDIIRLLLDEAARNGADIRLATSIASVSHDGARFVIDADEAGRRRTFRARNLVLATGGRSIPKMGATGLSYDIARRFGLSVTDLRPALVPLTFGDRFAALAGLAVEVRARADRGPIFEEAMLLTHRGLSGPAILQVSSYWREGEEISVTLLPGHDWAEDLRAQKRASPRRSLRAALALRMPERLADHVAAQCDPVPTLGAMPDARLTDAARLLGSWRLRPQGSEGWRTAEVTLGGIDTAGLSSATMEARSVPGLFAIGEAVDVTGWLGGYNFQWAWSSAAAAAEAIRRRGATAP
jgi:predicted Rossmann fold flavoprotein